MNDTKIEKLISFFSGSSQDVSYQTFKKLAKELPLHYNPPALTASAIQAAVLIPIIQYPQKPTILLTQRASHLRHHAGQISFPGGRMDEQDKDAIACALRETEEEIGLGQDKINIIGNLGVWPSYSGYLITPVVGIIQPPLNVLPYDQEVEAVFEIPFSEAFNISNYQVISKNTPLPHQYYEMTYENKKIWGFTAGILVLLAAYLKAM